MSCESECIWRLFLADEVPCYATSCGGAFTVMEGTPADNEMYYCPYCGQKLNVKEGEEACVTMD